MFTNNKLNKNKLNVFRYQNQLGLKEKYSNLRTTKTTTTINKNSNNPVTNFS